ncbi:hypothetical protein FKM82_028554 [Ascaphus truei]
MLSTSNFRCPGVALNVLPDGTSTCLHNMMSPRWRDLLRYKPSLALTSWYAPAVIGVLRRSPQQRGGLYGQVKSTAADHLSDVALTGYVSVPCYLVPKHQKFSLEHRGRHDSLGVPCIVHLIASMSLQETPIYTSRYLTNSI